MHLAAAVPLALGAAGAFAGSAVLQQRAARRAPSSESLSPRLFVRLVQQRDWLVGIGCLVAAYLLQAAALAFGPVAVVEPLIVLELAFALPIAIRTQRKWPGPREWLGLGCSVAGIGSFVALSAPSHGNATPGLARWALAAVPVAVLLAVALLLARGPERPARGALLALGAGAVFGLLALVTKSLVTVLGGGPVAALRSWQIYAVIVLGLGGLLVAQSAYQAAPLAVSLPIIDGIEPVTAVLLAAFVFGARLSVDAGALAGETAGAVLALTGVFLLGTSPLVLTIYEQTEREKQTP